MMTHTIKRDSWHFKLQNFGAADQYYGTKETDICTYTRRVIRGASLFLLVCSLALFGGYCVGDFIYWLYTGLMYEFTKMALGAFMTVIILGMVACGLVAAALLHTHKKYEDYKYAKMKSDDYVEPKPSFMQLAYRKFKDKTCFKLKVTDE
jgi:hypothetical protein